jgi:cellulose biosynthesis protein BcsQ
MKRYILIHEHRYGVSTYVFDSPHSRELLNDNAKEVCEQLLIDYEPEGDEYITIDRFQEDIPTVDLSKKHFMEKIEINTIEWASEICGMFMDEIDARTGTKLRESVVEDGETVIRYTETGQDIFNDMYDNVIDFIESNLNTTHDEHIVELNKLKAYS